jgi:O-antigen/teichoic acid export membrane protein
MFLVLSIVLIPRLGPLGAAIALVSSDVIAQSGLLSFVILREIMHHPLRYALFLLITTAAIVSTGAALGEAIKHFVPGTGFPHFVVEGGLWLLFVAVLASPLARRQLRERLIAALPV